MKDDLEDSTEEIRYVKFPRKLLKDVSRIASDMVQQTKRCWEQDAKKEFRGELDHASGFKQTDMAG
jgi:hypothetical protein